MVGDVTTNRLPYSLIPSASSRRNIFDLVLSAISQENDGLNANISLL